MEKEINGRVYKQVSPAYKICNTSDKDILNFGKYTFLYNGNWCPVKNYQMRSDLDAKFRL